MDTRIYVITHKKFNAPADDGYITLQVGHALGNDLGYIGDDTGENISGKNKNYCELTGVYWIWKNISCDIVGICHYRRYFAKDKSLLSKKYIEDTLQEYDAITIQSAFTRWKNLWTHYKEMHFEKDLQIVRDIISEKYPAYLPCFDLSMHCNLFTLGNMIITRKKIFDQYCEWLFDILFEAERRIDISEYDDMQKRIFGFLSERLLRVWLMNSNLRIREEALLMVEEDTEKKLTGMKLHVFELILKDLVENYQKGNYIDYADNRPLPIDFHGKIPVFVCWWQGFDYVPEDVRQCILSIQKNIPSDLAELHYITMDNVGEYITLPQWIIDRFVNGQMSDGNLSDILRFGLLYRYGGMWINADHYVASPITKEMLTGKAVLQPAPGQEGWSWDCIAGNAGSRIFQFMLNGLYRYWKMQDTAIDDQIMNYIMAVGCDSLPEIKETVETWTASQS